ncbi:MAG: TadE/TadG family type IV pilus assembly protein [Allorhizobium sp.]
MISFRDKSGSKNVSRKARGRVWRRLARSRDGAAAIEFAILAIPYFMIVFAIIETFVAFSAEQLLSNAVETLSRELRTGRITYNLGRTTDKKQTEFHQLFCNEISIMISCDAADIATPNKASNKLYLDVRTFTSFADMPATIPRVSNTAMAGLDTTSFAFTPGGSKSPNMLRAYYRWQIITDILRPYITTIRPADGSRPTDFLIVATTAFQNEDYP